MPRLATLYCSDFVKVEDDGHRCRGWAAGVSGAQYRAEFIKRNIRSQQDPSATQRVGGGGVGGGVCRGAPYFAPAGRRMRRRCRRARPRLRLLNAALTVTAAAAAAAGAAGGRRWRGRERGAWSRETPVHNEAAVPSTG